LFALLAVAILSAIFLNRTIWGRYLLALGRNETATRYSGINTDRMKIGAYVICSLLAGVGGVLFSLALNSIQPSGLGEFYELYAIAAAVLGGCSLRGGEGTITGVVIGTALLRVLYNAINILGIPTHLEFAIIGAVILAGVIADELVKRFAARRRAARELADGEAAEGLKS
jgi:ribose transport system permease protein